MISRELEILNTIYRSGGQCSIRKISKEMGLSSDYTSLIAKELLGKKLIKKITNNTFILTVRGRSFLENRIVGLGKKRKTTTLIEVSRSFGSKVESSFFEPEIHFIKKKFMPEQSYLTKYNLDKEPIIEAVDARSIQPSIKRLIFSLRKL